MLYDVVAIGEILIDFTPAGNSDQNNPLFERNAGGAPANVLIGLANLNRRTAFIGKVGEDTFGRYLAGLLSERGVHTDGMIFSRDEHTTLVFVELSDQGDRSFTFYRKPGADRMLSKEELRPELLRNSKIFHFGSVSLTAEPARSATLEGTRLAKEAGAVISFDPNLRLSLWASEEEARVQIERGLAYADIVKLSLEELEFIAGTADLEEGTKRLADAYNTKLLLVTLGPDGSFYRRDRSTGHVQAPKVTAVDTTGAGDAFLSGVLHQILEKNRRLEELSDIELQEILKYGNSLGSFAVTKKGASSSMPTARDIHTFMNL